MDSHHHVIYTLLFTLLFVFVGTQPVHAAPKVRPVISDELHLLNHDQINEIKRINHQLMKGNNPQQLWVITTNAPLKRITNDSIDYSSTQDLGFSLQSLSEDTGPYASYFEHKFLNFNEERDIKIFLKLGYTVNMIIVDPNLKYHIAPHFSDYTISSLTDIRNYILTKQINFNEVSGSNTMRTVDLIGGHIEKYVSKPEQISHGLSWDDLTFRIIFALIVIWIILHIRYRRKHPKRIWIEDPDEPRRDDNYDSGYLDGHYIGLHEDDDRDDH
ncbi:hypothetical protein [Lentilactobacillus otakiensis]|uniref:hypothetical protein n=1 Tax=Lentilactobacillus otakiensis TaxID=481720 RepID=UPI003D1847B0